MSLELFWSNVLINIKFQKNSKFLDIFLGREFSEDICHEQIPSHSVFCPKSYCSVDME